MRAKNLFVITGVGFLSIAGVTACGREDKSDKYEDGKLKISLQNLYFKGYAGGDTYLKKLQNDFEVKLSFRSYSWDDWDTQVNGQVNGGSLPDVFHANIDSYNYMSYYKFWAEEHITKPLPVDLSPWPNVKSLIDHTSNIEALKIDGLLYGIPVAEETTHYDRNFSPFTYMYRRDWAKQIDRKHTTNLVAVEEDGVDPIYEAGYTPIYKEGDVYTWAEFEHLLDVFAKELRSQNKYALGDVEWGFPSITNFYKQVPHCFAFDKTEGDHGKYVNNYLTDDYIDGLNKSKEYMTDAEKLWYFAGQSDAAEGDVRKQYYGNKIAVFYENLSYTNFMNIREELLKSNTSTENFNVDDATAIMRIKSPNGQYCLEGTDNWFSMTFFDRRISDNKMNKMLDIYDYLLSKKGTYDAIYGKEGYDYDYDPVTEEGHMIEENWEMNSDGTYKVKENGLKYLRQMVSLGYDTYEFDPVTNKTVVNYLNDWENEMKAVYVPDDPTTPDVNENETLSGLRVLKENEEVRWLTTYLKATFCGGMRDDALLCVMQYVYGNITLNDYKNSFAASGYDWPGVLNEINEALGYN